MTTQPPSLEEFLRAPAEQVAAVAPVTMFLAPGGTRREAILAGISPQSEEYPRWSRERMFGCIDMLFRLGVRHLFVTALRSAPLAEVGRFRERLLDWTEQGMAGPEALADYRRLGWRVRLAGAEHVPELRAAADRLRAATPAQADRTLWMYVSGTPDSHWETLLAAAQRARVRSRAELVRALYGEEIPPATLCLSWGKPMVAADLVPLLLAGELQCYWTQQPGFGQHEQTIRRIFYDYAYTRRTWRQDKSTRYAGVAADRTIWERPLVLGVGRRVGPFWYPAADEGGLAERTRGDL
ncbi:MAG TPA: hypothetical protein VKE41_21665 [Roseiflexaceae bacterium]|nr:hypothetical protein [Roseiflexaceae bacterium]